MAANRVIGVDNRLPWRLSVDLRRFKRITLGRAVIMGRRTFESIGKPLPRRQNIVVTNNAQLALPGCEVVTSLDAAIGAATSSDVMVIGGGSIYAQAMPRVTRLYLTLIEHDYVGDTYFPELDQREWDEVSKEVIPAGVDGFPHSYRFLVWDRCRA